MNNTMAVKSETEIIQKTETKKIMKRNYKREILEKAVETIFFLCAFISVVSVIAIIGFVFYKGLRPFVGEDAYSFVKFITGTRWAPSENVYGIFI